jgi:hypothetical protein
MLSTRLPSVVTFFVCVACGGAIAIDPDDGSGGTSRNGGATGSGVRSTGGVTGAGGALTGGVTGAGSKLTGGVTGAGGRATGGGNSGTRWAKEYDHSCTFDDDCVGVAEGPACSCNGCTNASINQNEYERWASAVGRCAPLPCGPSGCLVMVPACYSGTCGVRRVDYILPGQFDRTCSEQSDCHLVTVGDVCSGCPCEFDAVGAKGLEQYKARLENGPACGSPGTACYCEPPQPVCAHDGSSTLCAVVH